MHEELQQQKDDLLESCPGRRFRDHYDEHGGKDRGIAHRAAHVGLGVALVVAGALLSIPPLVPGFLVSLVGLAVMAREVRAIAFAFDWTEWKLRVAATRLLRLVSADGLARRVQPRSGDAGSAADGG